METKKQSDLKNFFIKYGVIIAGILLVMYLGKVWFISRGRVHERRQVSKSSADVISWQDAADHYGEYVTVEGRIIITHNSGKACFLNFHRNYKIYFTGVIFSSDFHKFVGDPEKIYLDKDVQITGKIKEYQGKPEIVITSPDQIKVIE